MITKEQPLQKVLIAVLDHLANEFAGSAHHLTEDLTGNDILTALFGSEENAIKFANEGIQVGLKQKPDEFWYDIYWYSDTEKWEQYRGYLKQATSLSLQCLLELLGFSVYDLDERLAMTNYVIKA